MKSKLKILALSAAVLAGFAAAPAHAYVYADSRLLLSSFNIGVNGPFAVNSFNFSTSSTAQLNNGTVNATGGSCNGNFNSSGTLTTNTCGFSPVLNAGPANAAGGGVTRGNLDFSLTGGSTTQQYSNAAASIDSSELLGAPSTTARIVAESNLVAGTGATALANIQSITGFTFTFTLMAPGALTLNFQADPDQFASVINELGGGSAQSGLSTSFTLQQRTGTNAPLQFATWAPTGTAQVGTGPTATGNDCIAIGVTCNETADGANLNATIGTTANNTTAGLSNGDNVFKSFGININGLLAGTYSLTLASTASTTLSRTAVIPEPDTILLLGVGLAGLAIGAQRRAKKQAA